MGNRPLWQYGKLVVRAIYIQIMQFNDCPVLERCLVSSSTTRVKRECWVGKDPYWWCFRNPGSVYEFVCTMQAAGSEKNKQRIAGYIRSVKKITSWRELIRLGKLFGWRNGPFPGWLLIERNHAIFSWEGIAFSFIRVIFSYVFVAYLKVLHLKNLQPLSL